MRWALAVLQAAVFAHALVPVAMADDPLQQSRSSPPVAVPAADIHDGPAPLRVCFDTSESYHPDGRAVVFT